MGDGFARIHADEDMGRAMFTLQIGTERAPCGEESGVVKRRRARDAANSVSSKTLFSHGREPVFPPVVPAQSQYARVKPKRSLTHATWTAFRSRPVNACFIKARPRQRTAAK